jgi:RNase P protein component
MTFAFSEFQRIKKENEFVHLLKNAKKVKNDFFFIFFKKQPPGQPVRHLG